MPLNNPHTNIPPPPDDDYWASLLDEVEAIAEIPSTALEDIDEDFIFPSTDNNLHTASEEWSQAETTFNADKTIELPIVGSNRGGLLAEWGSLYGFIPASQLIGFPSENNETINRQQMLAEYIGNTLQLRIIELDSKNSRLILSERAAVVAPGTRDSLINSLQKGDICTGTVTNLCKFGAFVDIGGIEGLIHISELSWGRVRHPSDILTRGQEINAYVIQVYPDEGRIALSPQTITTRSLENC